MSIDLPFFMTPSSLGALDINVTETADWAIIDCSLVGGLVGALLLELRRRPPAAGVDGAINSNGGSGFYGW